MESGLDDYIEDKLRGTFMTKASKQAGGDFRRKFMSVYWWVRTMFVAMMRGENMTSQLQSYIPNKVERIQRRVRRGRLQYKYPEWLEYFANTLRSDESKKGNTTYRTNMMKKENNLISFNLSTSSMG